MNIKVNNNYIKYSSYVFFILLDAIFLMLIRENYFLFTCYIIENIIFLCVFCSKIKKDDNVIFAIIFLLFYTWFIDILIHYLHQKVIFEAEFLFLIPLVLSCIRMRPKKNAFVIISLAYLFFNMLIAFMSGKVDIENYLKFNANILVFISFFYLFANITIKKEYFDLYKFLFIICFCVTLIQTATGFNTDVRNGVFSVFGFGAYTIFLMLFASFTICNFLYKKCSLGRFMAGIIIVSLLYICTESKAALVFIFLNIGILSAIQKGVSARKMFVFFIGIVSLPFAYYLLLKFNPKFSYMTSFDVILRYYTGNNNWKYEYGRFPAIINVFSDQDWLTRIIGAGFGSSTPLYMVFNNELGRINNFPYYIQKYGYYYGYQHTSISSLLLDGGLILSIFIILSLGIALFKTYKKIYIKEDLFLASCKFGVMTYILYYFTYANILKDFRAMAITAIVFAMCRMDKGLVKE